MKPFLVVIFYLCVTIIYAQPHSGSSFFDSGDAGSCLSPNERAALVRTMRLSRVPVANLATRVRLDWPVRPRPELGWENYYGVSNFVDHGPAGEVTAFNCLDRSYDGHRGTDIFSWPFPWYLQENDLVEVIAAAPGIIIRKVSHHQDQSCRWGSQPWNIVMVQHDDGSVAWYGHLKRNSLTPKVVGDRVAAGEFLGVMGSSGRSTGPHLHLELYDNDNNLVDPYRGGCNPSTPQSWWTDQRPSRNPTINALLTHANRPTFGCPASNETPDFSNSFRTGESVYVGLYLMDQLDGQSARLRLIDPAGGVNQEWNVFFTTTYNAAYWWWERRIGPGAPEGQWTVEATLNGRTVSHTFSYGEPTVGVLPPDVETAVRLSPNPAEDWVRVSGPVRFSEAEVVSPGGRSLLRLPVVDGQNIDLSKLRGGIYFLRLYSEQGSSLRKIVRR